MCAIDALGIPAMLNTELSVAGRCAICSAPIALQVRQGAMATVEPATAMVVARRDEAEPAFAACCPFTVFVCGQDHANRFAQQTSGAVVLPLAEALAHAEQIFGELLAGMLPATRPRGRSWLTGHGIAFIERDASRDQEAANALVATGTFATPLLVVEDRHVFGFRPDALSGLLLSTDDRES